MTPGADPIPVEQVALLPCPFCGGEAQTMFNGSQGTFLAYVECRACDAQTSTFYQKIVPPNERANIAWNTRARTEADRSVREALEPFVRHWQPWMDATDATDDGSYNWADDVPMSSFARVTFGDLRRARAALTGSNPAANGSEG